MQEIKEKQAEAEVVPNSSLVKIDVEVGVEVVVGVGVEVGVEVGVGVVIGGDGDGGIVICVVAGINCT